MDVIVDKLLNFVNYPDETPVLDGAGTAATALRFEAGGDASTVTGLTFQGYTSYALRNYSGTPAITLSNCVFNNCGLTLGLQSRRATATSRTPQRAATSSPARAFPTAPSRTCRKRR